MGEQRPIECPHCHAIYSMKKVLGKWYCPFCIDNLTDPDSIKIKAYLDEQEKARIEEKRIKKEKELKLEEERRQREAEELKKIQEEERMMLELEKIKNEFLQSKKLRDTGKIPDSYYLYDYHPKKVWKDGEYIPNSLKDNITYFIIDIKNSKTNALNRMVTELIDILPNLNQFTICIVPPSNSLKKSSGIKLIAKKISQKGAIDGTDCIKRKYTIPSQHSGERKSIQELKASLTIESEGLIKDKNVLLLDDVITRGYSLKSAKNLLLDKGAKSVICIALAKTSFDHNL